MRSVADGALLLREASMVFQGRLLLKVISTVLLLFVLSLVAFIVAQVRNPDPLITGIAVVMIGIPCVVLGAWVNTAFGSIRIDDQGILRKTLLGEKLIPWAAITRIKVWCQLEHAYYGNSEEQYVQVYGKDSKKLLLIKSSYEDGVYPYIHAEAQKRNLLESA